jgi:hypothetical protein
VLRRLAPEQPLNPGELVELLKADHLEQQRSDQDADPQSETAPQEETIKDTNGLE